MTDQNLESLPPRLQRMIAITPLRPNCWLWTGTTTNGYPRCRDKGRLAYAQRVIAEIFHPALAPHMQQMRNLCGEPTCVNPDHWTIYLGDGCALNMPPPAPKATAPDPVDLPYDDPGDLFGVEAAIDLMESQFAIWSPSSFEEVCRRAVFRGFAPETLRSALIRLGRPHLTE